jgi:hypothetical protein
MKKILMLVAGLLLSLNVYARDVADVRVAESAQVGNATLQLNGAGVRTRVIVDVYVAALYLGKKAGSAEEVLADAGNKRIALHMLYGMSSGKLLDAFKSALEANLSAAELSALDAQLKKFYALFAALSYVNNGDLILIDYVPATGTKVTINGVERGVVEGAEVNRALLKIWLGENPVQKDLKKELLGWKD